MQIALTQESNRRGSNLESRTRVLRATAAAFFTLLTFNASAGSGDPTGAEPDEGQGHYSRKTVESHVDVPPKALENHKRIYYPPIPLHLFQDGVVVLTFVVRVDGTVSDITIKASSGYTALDDAAIRTVSNWHYTPGTRDGKPFEFRMLEVMEYSIDADHEHP